MKNEAAQPIVEVRNLKEYFNINMGMFRTKPLKAVDNVSFAIQPGETLGLVGESGCGKSTLGRVLLQLYEQTAGSTMYYGRTLDTVAPEYVLDTLKNAEKYVSNYHKAVAHAEEMAKKCDALGVKATFFDI